MTKNIITVLMLGLLLCVFVRCSDWTDTKTEDLTIVHKTEEYYKSLRAFKQTPHSITFGWFGGWLGTGAATTATLAGIPDSMDMVSIWGKWDNLTPEQLRDLRLVQEKKGTKVLICSFTEYVGKNLTPPEIVEQGQDAIDEFWGWEKDEANLTTITDAVRADKWAYPPSEKQAEAIRKYARAFVDTVYKYGYDGFDMDHEPNFGGTGFLASVPARIHVFLETFHNEFKERGGGKLLAVDGEPQSLLPESGPFVDWMIVQAYSTGQNPNRMWDGNMDTRLNMGITNFSGVLTEEEVTNRYVLTEDFESAAMALIGGYPYTDRYGNSFRSLEGMARWQPLNGFRKGGTGTYHMEYEAGTSPGYRYMRKAIQIMNPAVN